MSDVKITSVRAIATAPQGSNLIIVRIDTNQPGLYGYCLLYTSLYTEGTDSRQNTTENFIRRV